MLETVEESKAEVVRGVSVSCSNCVRHENTATELLGGSQQASEYLGGENALPIPIDIVFEIFSRLPVKSIARCRCVSKTWASILSRREFTELFRRKSYVRPQLLIACDYGSMFLVFSSPQPQNPDENSPPIIPSYHMRFSFDGECKINGVVNGLVCVTNIKRPSKGRKETIPVICNPSTGESLPLKKAKTSKSTVRSMFGYDPIDNGFKVLAMAWGRSMIEEDHQVLSLGRTDKWRMVEHCIPNGRRRYLDKEVCINGVLYYQTTSMSAGRNAICCFDIRSEKFSVIKLEESIPYARLVNYDGNLGLLWSRYEDGCFVDQTSTSLKLWVLEDVERQEWSKRNLVLPPLWKYVVGEHTLSVVGVSCMNEIVFESVFPSRRLYVFYLNTNKNTIVKVEIQGLSQCKGKIRIFMNHVEDVKLM